MALWTSKQGSVVTITDNLVFDPSELHLHFNGFLQDVRIFTPQSPNIDHLQWRCQDGCLSCTGANVDDCIDCKFGFYAIETSNGLICVERTAKGFAIILMSLVTLVYIWRQWFPKKVQLLYKCHTHKRSPTHVSLSCGHMVCRRCYLTKQTDNTICPICGRLTEGLLRIKF